MNVPKSIPDNLTIPSNSIYRVHVLDEKFDIVRTIIYSRGMLDTTFPNTIISSHQIHNDDSIRTIKKKILAELWQVGEEWATEDMYLFANVRIKTTLQQMYDSTAESPIDGITYSQFQEIADGIGINLNIPPPPESKLFTFSEFFRIIQSAYPNEDLHQYNVAIPTILGQRFIKDTDFKFVVIPDRITSTTMAATLHKWKNTQNEMIPFENELLLNSGEVIDRALFICNASSIISKFGEEEQTKCIQIYFPKLFHLAIYNLKDLEKEYAELKKSTKKSLDELSFKLYQNVQLFYDIFHSRKNEIDYSTHGAFQGIHDFHLKIKTDFHKELSLELVFKNLHATQTIPFILYNPGNKRENIYRIYYEKYARDGRKIPYLPEKLVMRLARRIGKSKNISMYILHTHSDGKLTPVNLYFEKDGSLSVISDFKQTYSSHELSVILNNILNPVFNTLNQFLQSVGFFIRPFYSLDDSWVDIIKMNYIVHIPIKNNLNFSKNLNCIYSIMDKSTEPKNYEKKQGFSKDIFYTFKRVENYSEMDQVSAFIHNLLRTGYTREEILEELIEEYRFTVHQAKTTFQGFMRDFQYVAGEMDSPGFPVSFREGQIDKVMEIEFSEISSVKYLPHIQIYIDTIIRLSQFPDSIDIPKSYIDSVQATKTELKEADKPIEKIKPTAAAAKPPIISLAEDNIHSIAEEIELDEDDIMFLEESDDDNTSSPRQNKKKVLEETPGEDIMRYAFSSEESSDSDSDGEIMFFDDSDNETDSQMGSGAALQDQHGEGAKAKPDEESDYDEEEFQRNPDGAKIPFLKRLQARDPELFLASRDGKYKAYATKCQAKSQPIILTDREKNEIDEKNPGSYHHAVKYGSDAKHAHWYICPRFWCFKTNRSISEEDVKAGKCGKIIPYGKQTIPKGHYVYEFKRDGENEPYVEHNPGFMTGKHPKNLCLPCCYKNFDTEAQKKRRDQCAMKEDAEDTVKNNAKNKDVNLLSTGSSTKYIISLDTYPLPQYRWGFLPIAMQLFLGVNYSKAIEKTTSASILPNVPVFLRFGIEQSANQSFLGCMADIYSSIYDYMTEESSISIANYKRKLLQKLTLTKFMELHNGELISAFKPVESVPRISASDLKTKYKISVGEDERKNTKKRQMYSNAAAAYEKFKEYLLSETNVIDHTYLWEIFTSNLMYNIGFNLILLEVVSNDMTDNIQLICPTSSFSLKSIFDDTKSSIIILKHDNFYEPVYLYENTGKEIRVLRWFDNRNINENIKRMLENIKKTSNKYCARLPSLPQIHRFDQPVPLTTLIEIALENAFYPSKQIMNYRGKIIGLCFSIQKKYLYSQKIHEVYIPCYPSSPIPKIEIIMADDIDEYAVDYETTKNILETVKENILKPNIKNPVHIGSFLPKFKVLEEGIVVGFLTAMNQFVPIHPVSENIHMDNIPERTLEYGNPIETDMDLALSGEDKLRLLMTKKIHLETQFFNAFRNKIRKLLNDQFAVAYLKQVNTIINHTGYTYHQKLANLEKILRALAEEHIVFNDIDDDVLMELHEINDCSTEKDSSQYCIFKENEIAQLVIPSKHLLSGHSNEKIYFGRIADDLIRNERVRLFMINSKKYLNVQNSDYRINDNEFLMVHSFLLDKDYFKGIQEFNSAPQITQSSFDTASPYIHRTYTNDMVSLEEQYNDLKIIHTNLLKNNQCVKEVIPIIGNERRSLWKRIFPDTAKEVVFHDTKECSFYILSFILQNEWKKEEKFTTEISDRIMRQIIWTCYKQHLETEDQIAENLPKIIKILKQQGKYKLIQSVERGVVSFEDMILSDVYYLSDLDIWMVADKYKLPIILFNPNTIKGFGDLEWIRMGGQTNSDFYFIRTKITSELNHISNYHLITPTFKTETLPEFHKLILSAIQKDTRKHNANIQSLKEFLENYM